MKKLSHTVFERTEAMCMDESLAYNLRPRECRLLWTTTCDENSDTMSADRHEGLRVDEVRAWAQRHAKETTHEVRLLETITRVYRLGGR